MLGEFEVTLDTQGRIRLPASVRKHLVVVVFRFFGYDLHIAVLTMNPVK